MNTLTQLVRVAGVHRLTTRVSTDFFQCWRKEATDRASHDTYYADDQAKSSTDDKDQCDSKGSVLGLEFVWTRLGLCLTSLLILGGGCAVDVDLGALILIGTIGYTIEIRPSATKKQRIETEIRFVVDCQKIKNAVQSCTY